MSTQLRMLGILVWVCVAVGLPTATLSALSLMGGDWSSGVPSRFKCGVLRGWVWISIHHGTWTMPARLGTPMDSLPPGFEYDDGTRWLYKSFPSSMRDMRFVTLRIRLWVPVVVSLSVGIPACVVRARRMQAIQSGACPHCGYTPGYAPSAAPCPECGRARA